MMNNIDASMDEKATSAREHVSRLKAEGNDFFGKGEFVDALSRYTEAIIALRKAKSPVDALILLNRSATYLALKRFVPAMNDAIEAIKLDPSNWKGHWRQGVAMMSMPENRTKQAIEAFQKCAECESLPANKKAEVASQLAKAKAKYALQGIEVPVCLTDLYCTSKDISMKTAAQMSGVTELFKKHSPSSFEAAMNNTIKASKYAVLYYLLNTTLQTLVGMDAELNWRWLDPNLFLIELKLHEFEKFNWYNDVELHHCNPALNLENIMATYSRLNDFDKIDILKKSVIDPLDAYFGVEGNMRAMNCESSDPAGASAHYLRAIALDPHCLPVLYNYAELLTRHNKYKEAERCLNQLLILDPQHVKAWGMRALCYEKTMATAKAIECYERAYHMDNTSKTRLLNFALLLVDIANFPRAKALFEEVIELDPQDGVVIGAYADLLHSMNLKDAAVVAFERALATKNVNHVVINDYAVLLRVMGMERNNPALVRKGKELIESIPKPGVREMINQVMF